eukprot:3570025-Rhodomonas_salina.2
MTPGWHVSDQSGVGLRAFARRDSRYPSAACAHWFELHAAGTSLLVCYLLAPPCPILTQGLLPGDPVVRGSARRAYRDEHDLCGVFGTEIGDRERVGVGCAEGKGRMTMVVWCGRS